MSVYYGWHQDQECLQRESREKLVLWNISHSCYGVVFGDKSQPFRKYIKSVTYSKWYLTHTYIGNTYIRTAEPKWTNVSEFVVQMNNLVANEIVKIQIYAVYFYVNCCTVFHFKMWQTKMKRLLISFIHWVILDNVQKVSSCHKEWNEEDEQVLY